VGWALAVRRLPAAISEPVVERSRRHAKPPREQSQACTAQARSSRSILPPAGSSTPASTAAASRGS
jgi:hypothetical protein